MMNSSGGKNPLELKIFLNHLEHNFLYFKSLLNSSTKIMVMVKADAYGCGAVEVSKKMEELDADYLGVALTQEGVELREAGIKLPIMVITPLPEELPYLIKYQLEPEISSPDLLDHWLTVADKKKEVPYGFHLKIDTGLHRLGVWENEMEDLIERIKENQTVKILSVFSHLSSSPMEIHDSFTLGQFDRFEKWYEKIVNTLHFRPDRHILNSAGIFRFPEYQYEMVRLGVGLYGAGLEDLEISSSLKPVQELCTSIAQIKEIEAGEAVGYSRMEVASDRMKIAVLRAGYADGISRRAGNRHFSVWIDGAVCPIIGNVCMDMMMADISDQPHITLDSTAEIYGRNHPIHLLAEASDTIPYEILTSNHRRARKIFLS